jgi:hypothetical protein
MKVKGSTWTSGEWRGRNKPIMRQSRAGVESALDAHDRIRRVSTEIRERHSLSALEDGLTVRAWRVKLAGSAPLASISLDDLAKRRAKIKRDEAKLDRDLRELVASRTVPAVRIAEALGVSRQRVYQLA